MDCLFCKFIDKSITTNIVYEDNDVIAFDDINPQAPIHQLIIPKKHIENINALSKQDEVLAGKLILTAQKLAHDAGIAESGYRTVLNCNSHGGQEVYHIHLHLLGGRQMTWPPG